VFVGPSGLMQGDVITGIENCPVKDLDSWYTCLEDIWGSEPVGYCVSNDNIVRFANNSEGSLFSHSNSLFYFLYASYVNEFL